MAIVTGLTAARMLAIEAASVVDGEVVGDNLVLTKHDGSEIDAGDIRGPRGPQGPGGLGNWLGGPSATYDPLYAYVVDDITTGSDGRYYINVVPCTGVDPVDDSDFSNWVHQSPRAAVIDASPVPIAVDSSGITEGQGLFADATGKLKPGSGIASVVWRGNYAAGTTYAMGEGVWGSNGHGYVSKINGNIGHDPTTDAGVNWSDQLPSGSMLLNSQNLITKRQRFSPALIARENRAVSPRPGLCPLADVVQGGASKSQVDIGVDIAGKTNPFGTSAKVLKLVATGVGGVWFYPGTTKRTRVNPGEVFTATKYLYQPSTNSAARSYMFQFNFYKADTTLLQQFNLPVTPYAQDAWVRASASMTVPDLAAQLSVELYIARTTTVVGEVFYTDGWLEEADVGIQDYGDGATAGWGWDGTANDSSSRSPAGSEDSVWQLRSSGDGYTLGRLDNKAKLWLPGFDAMSKTITGVADPVNVQDAVNKRTLDARVSSSGSLNPSYYGTDLWDVTEPLASKSIYTLRDNYEERKRTISESIFGDILVPEGSVVFAFTSDDGPEEDYSDLWPLIRTRCIPWSHPIILTSVDQLNKLSWVQMAELRNYGGCEMMSHSRSHIIATYDNFVSEAITAADDLAAGDATSNFYVDALVQPGTWTGTSPFYFDSPGKIDPPSLAGAWLRSRYSAVTAYINQYRSSGVYVYPYLPVPRRYGLARCGSIDTTSVAAVKGLVNQAESYGGGLIVFAGHAASVATGNGWAVVQDVLDYIAGERDSGRVHLMTLTAAFHARFGTPRNLAGDGDFHMETVGTYGSGGEFVGCHWVAGAPTIVEANNQTGPKPPGTTRSIILNSAADDVMMNIAPGLRSIMVEFDARTKNGVAPNTQQAQVKMVHGGTGGVDLTVTTAGATGPLWPSLPAAWTHHRCLFGCDPQSDGGYALHLKSTGVGGVEYANVKITQV